MSFFRVRQHKTDFFQPLKCAEVGGGYGAAYRADRLFNGSLTQVQRDPPAMQHFLDLQDRERELAEVRESFETDKPSS